MTDFTKLASDFQRYFGELQKESTRSIDKESLMWFAKTAARAYLTDKVPLNDSILKIAEREKDLNTDHLKRISEMANNEVFEQLFNNSTDKNVHFDVANVDSIMSKVAGRDIEPSYNLSSYKKTPGEVLEKIASSFETTPEEGVRWGRAGGAIGSMLGGITGAKAGWQMGGTTGGKVVGGLVGLNLGARVGHSLGKSTGESTHRGYSKSVSKDSIKDEAEFRHIKKHANPVHDLYDLQEKLKATKEELETEKLATSHNMKIAYNSLFKSVKTELRGTSFTKIAQAMHSVSSSDNDLNVLEDISYDLMKERAASIDQLNVNPGKISPVAVNKEHPVVENFTEYTKLSHYKNQIDIAIKEIDDGLNKTSSAIIKMNKRN